MYSTAALAFCVWIMQSSRYLDTINKHHITLTRFLKFASYLSVDIIAIILPISLSISAGFVFHRLIVSNQITALQSLGASPQKLLLALMPLTIIVTGYLYVSNAYLSPRAWSEFRNLEFQIKNNINPPETAGSIFTKDNFAVYSQKYIGNFSFENLIIIDSRNEKKTYTYSAKNASINNNELFLLDGERIEIDNITGKNSIIKFETYRYDLTEIIKTKKAAARPNEKIIYELLETTEDEKLNAEQYALFHQKMISPLLTVIFSLLAFFIIIQSKHKRKTSYTNMFIFLFLIVFYQGFFFWIANASVKNTELITLNYIIVFVLIILLSIAIFIKGKRVI